MSSVPQKRTLVDILFRVPKENFERGPRPPLHHPDVIKAREERAKLANDEKTVNNSDNTDNISPKRKSFPKSRNINDSSKYSDELLILGDITGVTVSYLSNSDDWCD